MRAWPRDSLREVLSGLPSSCIQQHELRQKAQGSSSQIYEILAFDLCLFDVYAPLLRVLMNYNTPRNFWAYNTYGNLIKMRILCKGLQNLIGKKHSPVKKSATDPNRHCSKAERHMVHRYIFKMFNITNHQENGKPLYELSPQWPVRMATVKQTKDKCWWGVGGENTADANGNGYDLYRSSRKVLWKLKPFLPYGPPHLQLDMHPHGEVSMLHSCAHRCTVHKAKNRKPKHHLLMQARRKCDAYTPGALAVKKDGPCHLWEYRWNKRSLCQVT